MQNLNEQQFKYKNVSTATHKAARELVETLELYASVVGQADMAGKDFRTGVNHTGELDKMKKELEDTNDEVKTLAERFAELTAVLLGPGFAEERCGRVLGGDA